MADYPQIKSNKPSVSINATLYSAKKSNRRKEKQVKFANLTMEETSAFDDCNLSMLTHVFRNIATDKVPKGQFVFDTGANVHVCTDASMFKPNEPPKFTEIIGVEGRPMEAEVGSFLCLGRCLLIPNCPVGLISSHVLESMGFNIEYHSGINYIVHITSKLALVFKKANNSTMNVCDIVVSVILIHN